MKYKKLKIKYEIQKEMRKHYQTLFSISVSELKNKNMQVHFLRNLINEIDVLNDNNINKNLIKGIIRNGLERHQLDIMVHNQLIANENNNRTK